MIGIRHIGITVYDLEKMKSFYQDLLGFTIVKEALESGEYINNFYKMKGVEVITVKMKDSRNSGVLLELFQYKSHPAGQAERLRAVPQRVASRVDRGLDRLDA